MTKSCCEPYYTLPRYIRLLILVWGIVLWYMLSLLDLTSVLWSTEISDNLRIIFLLWLVASVSTCLAVTGGVIVWYTEIASSEHNVSTQAWLHIWRVVWFIVFGGILWILGEQISYSLWFSAWLNLIISLLLLVLAFQIIWCVPKLKWNHSKSAHEQSRLQKYSSNWRCSAAVWSMTFFIPCGFTQMVQIMALASGSLLSGWVMMWVFALWTLPWLVLLSVGTTYAKISHKRKFEWVVAVVLIAFSLYSIQWSLWLLWFNDMVSRVWSDSVSWIIEGEAEVIRLVHNGLHLVPEDTVLETGKNYEITIVPDTNGIWCMSSIALPSLDKNVYPVQEWEEIVYLLQNPNPWTYTFVCSSMGMSQWKIIVK